LATVTKLKHFFSCHIAISNIPTNYFNKIAVLEDLHPNKT